MPWRFNFRKSISRGPFRWTLTQKGVSTSVGIPGLRFGVSSNGKRRLTIGIPGTGMYWTNNLDASDSTQNSGQPGSQAAIPPRQQTQQSPGTKKNKRSKKKSVARPSTESGTSGTPPANDQQPDNENPWWVQG